MINLNEFKLKDSDYKKNQLKLLFVNEDNQPRRHSH